MTPPPAWRPSACRPLRSGFRPSFEALEARDVPAIFAVTNALDAGLGSLRQAILDANAAANVGGVADEIQFAVPGGNSASIVLQSELPDITEAVLLDGTTQSDAAGAVGVELNGAAVGGDGLVLRDHTGSQVRGLVVNRFGGHGVRITGGGQHTLRTNFIGTSFNGFTGLGNGGDGVLIFGSTENLVTGNVIAANTGNGVSILDAAGNTVSGNLVGTNATGLTALGNLGDGVLIAAAGANQIGGPTATDRNVISGNGGNGVAVVDGPGGSTVQGNFIGTNLTGGLALANQLAGVLVVAPDNTITSNVISGNGGDGVFLAGSESTGNVIEGNTIGSDTGQQINLGNGGDGISLFGASDNLIGDFAGNVIMFNAGAGVKVVGGAGNKIENFRTFGNGGLGIDLGGDGVTPNDDGDADAGANNLQNSPVLVSAVANVNGSNTTEVSGTLNSTPNTTFLIRVFSNRAGDPSGFGEGDTARGEIEVTTDAQGVATFTLVIPFRLVRGDIMTATATNLDTDDTSEFSNPVVLEASGGVIVGTVFNDLNGNGVKDAGEPALGGVTVFVDADGNGQLDAGEVSSVTDDAEGEYVLVVAQDGTFVVRAVVPAGLRQTTANPAPVGVAGGEGFLGGDFGFQAIAGGTVSGVKYLDLNGNGVLDPNEPGIGGFRLFADLNDNGCLDPGEPNAISAADGSFTLTIPQDGTFLVREAAPQGFRQTTPDRLVTVAGGNAVGGLLVGNRARDLTAALRKVKRNGRKLLQVVVRFADTGEIKRMFYSPFQNPVFRRIRLTTLDADGDGAADTAVMSARRVGRFVGKKKVLLIAI